MRQTTLICWMTLLLVKGLSAQSLKMPDIPAELKAPAERAGYLALHYWDNFCFADTSLLRQQKEVEQAFVDFLQVLPYAPTNFAESGMINMLNKAHEKDSLVFAWFTGLYEKYLYESTSPVYNEELYIPVVHYICSSSRIGALDKVRPRYQLGLVLKNRKDSIATDFTYTLPNGKEEKLSDLKADYTLLFFNDPDCDLCQQIKKELAQSAFLSSMQQEHLTVLAIYPNEEEEIWRREQYPPQWINGHDALQVIRTQTLYDLKHFPVLYLLDKDKRVILKNTSVLCVEEFFRNLQK